MIPQLKYSAAIAFGACVLSACVQPKQASLYPAPDTKEQAPHIGNCYTLQIFEDNLSSDVWFTQNASCIEIKETKSGQFAGEGALHIKWNKPQSTCDWIGMGIGWDDWFAKDLHQIIDSAAIQFHVRNIKGVTKGLPWAIAFEDYGNAQAWCGMSPNFIENGEVTEAWTKVTIPLSEFDYSMQEPDMRTVKQIIIQFEGDGEILLDDIKLVRSSGSTNKVGNIMYAEKAPVIDAKLSSPNEWTGNGFELQNGNIHVRYDADMVYVFAQVKDNDPLQNNKQESFIWNGDAIEIAFATNPEAYKLRRNFLLSDMHIGIRANNTPMIWDWRAGKQISADVRTAKTADGYMVEAAISWKSLNTIPWKAGNSYGFECAIDDAPANGDRTSQERWNDNYNADFHINPSQWGRIEVR